jgi:hypothetical protein
MSKEELNPALRQTDVSSRSIAVEWWNNLPTTDRFRLLQENGYQDQKKPWKYRPLTDKGIYLIWCRQNGC